MSKRSCHHEDRHYADGIYMTISGKYELLRPLSEATGFRSFHARHVLTGQEVMVHFLNPGQRYESKPVTDAGPAPPEWRAQVLDAGTYEGTQFLVTYPMEDFAAFSAWLKSVAPVKRSSVSPPGAFGRASGPSSSITAQVRRPEIAAGFTDVSPRVPASANSEFPKPAAAGASTSPVQETGGFTARFSAAGGAPAPPTPAPAWASPPPAPSGKSGSSEFSAMFKAQGGSTPPPPTPAFVPPAPSRMPSSVPDTGSFAKMFGPSAGAPPPPVASGTAPPSQHDFSQKFLPEDRNKLPPAPLELGRPAAAPSSPSSAGEFTMLFKGIGGSPNLAPPAATDPIMPQPVPAARNRPVAPPPFAAPQPEPPRGDSSFEGATQLFHGPSQPARSAPAPFPLAPSGPSEFTMIVRGGGQSGSPGNLPQAAAMPGVPPPPSSAAGPAFPGINMQAPTFRAPQISAPSVTGPSVSANGIVAPSFQAPQLYAPSLGAPRLDMQMPSAGAAAAGAAGATGRGGTFSPILAAVLACVGTVALLAIVYVLTKR